MKFNIEEKQADGTFVPASYDLDFSTLTNVDIGELEEQSGWSFDEFQAKVARREMRAITAQVWLAKRRVVPDAKFKAMEFRLTNLDFEPNTAELRSSLDALPVGDPQRAKLIEALTDEQRAAVADLVDPIPTEAPVPPGS